MTKRAIITIRCTQKQKDEIVKKSKKQNLTVTDLMLNSALDKKFGSVQSDILKFINDLSYKDSKLDNNINQIAFRLNSNQIINNEVLKDILKKMKRVEKRRRNIENGIISLIRIMKDGSENIE